MNALLNGHSLTTPEAQLLLNRGFRYGDGCFETIMLHKGTAPLLHLHLQRLQKSLPLLQLNWPEALQLPSLLQPFAEGSTEWQRLRLWLWRSGDGLYTPQSQETQFALMAEASAPPQTAIRKSVGLCQHTRLAASRWSFIKSISAQAYVQASLEKKEKGVEELLLLNEKGELVEASSANLFIKKRNRWFTPALSTGCVAGVMRAHLMQQLLQKGEPAYEVHALPEELEKVDKVVCTNVGGLYPLQQYGERHYNTDIDELLELLPPAYRQAL
ncbi:aminotransferase class IV [Cesiribacter andamanensis]|uniref:branched-chain-amino-acid transaminase n=1 Tax=Cesiribacter andamanensis AMV16 TaxID=1279009 RepID=M7NH01_9BACT|nr:aminotransferase class IV [Cesiribacter andamanensis]EMR01115.1 Aminodeoxychorismate lyase [Cesiribacter andamanensis AMV16]